MAVIPVKELVRLYPRSWRRRYGREMEVLLEDTPSEIGVALDLVLGAGAAYAEVVRSNRILSAAGAFLNAICTAALLQAIVFVAFTLIARNNSPGQPKLLAIGPIALMDMWYPELLGLAGGPIVLPLIVSTGSVFASLILLALIGALCAALLAPRLAWRAMTSLATPPAARRPAGVPPPRRDRRGSPSRRGS